VNNPIRAAVANPLQYLISDLLGKNPARKEFA
jgi:hypothetical protein